jgi:hypothetical protein
MAFLFSLFFKKKTNQPTTTTKTSKNHLGWMWWHMPVIPALERLRQED